ncbi:hypothetical protein D3C76_657520 [compost metagenome]
MFELSTTSDDRFTPWNTDRIVVLLMDALWSKKRCSALWLSSSPSHSVLPKASACRLTYCRNAS